MIYLLDKYIRRTNSIINIDESYISGIYILLSFDCLLKYKYFRFSLFYIKALVKTKQFYLYDVYRNL